MIGWSLRCPPTATTKRLHSIPSWRKPVGRGRTRQDAAEEQDTGRYIHAALHSYYSTSESHQPHAHIHPHTHTPTPTQYTPTHSHTHSRTRTRIHTTPTSMHAMLLHEDTCTCRMRSEIRHIGAFFSPTQPDSTASTVTQPVIAQRPAVGSQQSPASSQQSAVASQQSAASSQ